MRRLFIALAVFGFAADAHAIWDKYSPFPPGKEPARFPVTKLSDVQQVGDPGWSRTRDLVLSGSKIATLRVTWPDDGECHIDLRSLLGKILFSTEISASPLCNVQAVQVDLNGDRIPDYIVVSHSGGNGLAAQYTYITFLLSSPNGYHAQKLLSYDAAAEDLFDLDHDGRPEFLHCMCVWGDHGKDGRAHNYWVYNLLGFSGTDIVSANACAPAFPSWVMYSYEPNHRDTPQLTADQRERQWLKTWEWEAHANKEMPFLKIELFAAEQRRRH